MNFAFLCVSAREIKHTQSLLSVDRCLLTLKIKDISISLRKEEMPFIVLFHILKK